MAQSRRLSAAAIVSCALFAALTAVCSQIQIPLPMVPMNLALFAVHLCGAVLGPVYGTLSIVVYVLLGLCGLPVFCRLWRGCRSFVWKHRRICFRLYPGCIDCGDDHPEVGRFD